MSQIALEVLTALNTVLLLALLWGLRAVHRIAWRLCVAVVHLEKMKKREES